MREPHQISKDFGDFEPATMLAACATKRLWAKISFGTEADEHPARVFSPLCIMLLDKKYFALACLAKQ